MLIGASGCGTASGDQAVCRRGPPSPHGGINTTRSGRSARSRHSAQGLLTGLVLRKKHLVVDETTVPQSGGGVGGVWSALMHSINPGTQRNDESSAPGARFNLLFFVIPYFP